MNNKTNQEKNKNTFETFKMLNPQHSENTRKLYAMCLRKLHERGNFECDVNDLCFLQDYGTCIEIIEKSFPNITTRRQQLSILQSVSNCLGFTESALHYTKKASVLWDTIKENAVKQELTERQKKNWITDKQFQQAVKQSVKNARLSLLKDPNDESTTYQDYLNVQEALILQFYRLYPLRNDLVDTIFVRTAVTKNSWSPETDKNYVYKKNKSFYLVLNRYKTWRKYGQQTFLIKSPMTKYCKWLFDDKKFNSTDALILTNSGTRMTRNNFSRCFADIMEKHVGVRASTCAVRHCVISETFKDDAKLTKRQELAKTMLHSVATQQGCYEKKMG